jgi:hypothetical protein
MDSYGYWTIFLLGLKTQEMPFREPRSNGRGICGSAPQEQAITDTAMLENILHDIDPLIRPQPNKVYVYGARFLFVVFLMVIVFYGLFFLLRDKWFLDRMVDFIYLYVLCSLCIWTRSVIRVIRSIFRPEENLRKAILTPVKDEMDHIIAQLVIKYERRHLEYALERVTFGAAQERLSNALNVGALDKVGIIPLFLGAVFSVANWWKFFSANKGLLAVLAVGLGIVYLRTISLYQSLKGLDHATLALKHAVDAKKFEEAQATVVTPSFS